MKKLTVCILALLVGGCAGMTVKQKRVTAIVAGALITGAIAAHEMDRGAGSSAPGAVGQPPSCSPQPNGTCR